MARNTMAEASNNVLNIKYYYRGGLKRWLIQRMKMRCYYNVRGYKSDWGGVGNPKKYEVDEDFELSVILISGGYGHLNIFIYNCLL